jgi:hypothetical protein
VHSQCLGFGEGLDVAPFSESRAFLNWQCEFWLEGMVAAEVACVL